MANQQYASCIEACNACASACDFCAASCLQEQDVKMMARCIALDMDCAQICRLAAGYMARGSEHAKAICRLCADICQTCADECGKHQMSHCQECAAACKRCAEECRRMAA
ncbi:four-helix bundle copper-binding protein [Noviherbaspirillum pedocola]|uniref:Four-helix bundle copper-binding protein n=1 Tax=Noviherbaspirillum pedocola TaxID=2801341 RepID=A0A934T3D8_9BURK|nr:four-helix bundle copper-binding protein [Noviherbaspirillum pedocola]MBK4738824.1 four-helix bundle copper-binding protein [Noviherbaspirillum pedocola]